MSARPTTLLQSYEGHTSLVLIILYHTYSLFPWRRWPAIRSFSEVWLGRKDSNLRMPGPKPGALPLGDAPIKDKNACVLLLFFILLIRRCIQTRPNHVP